MCHRAALLPFPGRLSDLELHDLNAATHELTVTVGRTLRREALQAHNIVALDTEAIGLPQAQPMTSTEWAFTSACQRLADARPPLEPPDRPATGHAREQLRTALEETVVGNPPPIRRMRPSPVRGPKPPGAGGLHGSASQPVTPDANAADRVPAPRLSPANPHHHEAGHHRHATGHGVERTGGQR